MMALRAAIAAGLFLVLVGLVPAVQPAAAQTDETVVRLLAEAAQLEQEGDLEGALEKLGLLSEQFPQAPATAEALLRVSVGNRQLGRDEAAEAAARTLIGSHPRSLQAAGAYTLIGSLQAARAANAEELDEARVTLENVALLFPRTAYLEQPWRAEAAVLAAQVARRQGRDDAAARSLAEVIDLEPRSRWTMEARIELAALLLDRAEWRVAAGLLQESLRGHGESDEESALAGRAESLLTLVHRLGLRVEAGRQRWLGARLVSSAPERPSAVAARRDGRIAVTGAKGSTVVLSADGAVVSRWSHDDAGRSSWHGTELVVATQEAAATFPGKRNLRFAAPPSEKKPTIKPLVAVEPATFDRWVVLADKPPRVLIYAPGRRLSEALVAGKGRQPVDLARDRRGRLLVLDAKTHSVTRFADGDTSGTRLASGSWDSAEAVSVDAMGNIYVLDRGSRRIDMFDRTGERLTSLGPSLPGGLELDRPMDLTVDDSGRLWIADARLGLVVLE